MAYMTMVAKPWIFGSDGTFPALISAQNRDLDIQKQHLKYVVIWQPFFNTHRWSFECVFFVIYYFRNSMDEERFLNHTFLLSQHCTIDKLRPINPIWHRPQTTDHILQELPSPRVELSPPKWYFIFDASNLCTDICKTIFVILEVQVHHGRGLSETQYLELFSQHGLYIFTMSKIKNHALFNLFWTSSMIAYLLAEKVRKFVGTKSGS